MSCKECEENPINGFWYRWSNANIQIIACEKHLLEIRDALNRAQATTAEANMLEVVSCLSKEYLEKHELPKVQ